MKKISLVFVALTAALLGGCASTVKDIHVADMNTELVSAKFKPKVEIIGESATGTAVSHSIVWGLWTKEKPDTFANQMTGDFGFSFGSPIKDAAVYNACEKVGADILLAPIFTIKKESGILGFEKEVVVTVKGVPAKIVGAEEIPFEKWCELTNSPACCK